MNVLIINSLTLVWVVLYQGITETLVWVNNETYTKVVKLSDSQCIIPWYRVYQGICTNLIYLGIVWPPLIYNKGAYTKVYRTKVRGGVPCL